MGTSQIISHQELMGGLSEFVNMLILYAKSCVLVCLLYVRLYQEEFS